MLPLESKGPLLTLFSFQIALSPLLGLESREDGPKTQEEEKNQR